MKYVKSSAMPLAVMFSALAAVFLASVMGYWQESMTIYSRSDAMRQADAAMYASCIICCRDMGVFPEGSDTAYVRPFAGKDIEVEVVRTMHGLYELLTFSVTLPGGGVLSSSRLIGYGVEKDGIAVVVKDAGRDVSLGAECFVESPLYVPGGRYRVMSAAAGKAHRLSSHVDIRESQAVMPEVECRAESAVREIYRKSDGDMVMLSGEDTLPDMVISARCVVVDSLFRNSVQIFARDSIVLQDGAYLEYPSGLFLESSDGMVRLMGKSVVEGYVIVTGGEGGVNAGDGNLNYVQSDSAAVRGQLFVEGLAEVKGTVNGSIYVTFPVSRTGRGYSPMTVRNLTQLDDWTLPGPVFMQDSSAMDVAKVLPRSFRAGNHEGAGLWD